MIPSVDNVIAVYLSASDDAVREGMVWYEDAHAFSTRLDPANSYRAAGVIAALSPMNGWSNNKNKAAQLYAQGEGTGCGLSANVAKAMAIYNGANPLDVLKGDKVRAFYSTIIDPTGDVTPVIDRHAFDIAVGQRTDDKTRSQLARKGIYETFSDIYRQSARLAGIGSAQMQAITWVAWREQLGITW